MPSQIAHILLGREAAPSLPAGWFRRFSDSAFRLGCQGPDVFYHNRRTKPGAFLYGTRLHRRGWGEFLSRFRREALDRGWGPDHPGLAFLAGQATHGFLDRRAHPFVVYFSGWKVPGDPLTNSLRHSHAFFERILDVLLWEHRMRTPFDQCDWQDDFPGPEHFPEDFWTAWAEALHEVFPQLSARADVEVRLKNAVGDTRGFLAFTAPSAREHARRAARHGALHWFHPEALPEWDFLNLAHAPWQDPVSGESRNESMDDLFSQAAAEASAVLATLADRSADWNLLLGNGSLNLPGSEGENNAPRFSRPWNYEELYDREVRARLSDSPQE
jgi:hypothetical protein